MTKAKFRTASGRVIGYIAVADAVRRAIASGRDDYEMRTNVERVLVPVIDEAMDGGADPQSLANALSYDLGALKRNKLVGPLITSRICYNLCIDNYVDDEGHMHILDPFDPQHDGGNA